ncbi:MAG: MFS transporter [Methanoregula sp.]|nr:MAG: MFS transporter [Methanoregula sp.]
MRDRIPLCFCAFAVMALSNAIVPILPSTGDGAAMQGAVYAAYFIGAFIATLPGGLIADRLGPVKLIRSGIILSALSGLLLLIATGVFFIILFRFLEGIAAGIFIASALAWINEQTDHVSMSGFFMASLNAGLICGLVVTGLLVSYFNFGKAGIAFFFCMCLIGSILVFLTRTVNLLHRDREVSPEEPSYTSILCLAMKYRWLWLSAIILTGATGVVTSLYPGFSGDTPQMTALYISVMNVGTIAAVIIASRFALPPIPTIRFGAVIMAVSVFACYFTHWGFVFVGASAGCVMIAQMAFLSGSEIRQGKIMGLYTTASYAGMSSLPFIAGFVAEKSSYFSAFVFTVFSVLFVALTIGWCRCYAGKPPIIPATGKQ